MSLKSSGAVQAASVPGLGFDAELLEILEQGRSSRKALVFHVDGAQISGVVRSIGAASIVIGNHEHGRILIRLDRISAIEGD